MSNICDTQYKVRGSRKALSDLWNTLQMMGVNSKDVYLYKLAEHYGNDCEHSGISVRGHIYWAEFEDNKDGGLLSFDTESAWTACDLFFDELNKVLGNAIEAWCEKTGISQGERTEEEMVDFINEYEYDSEDTYYYIHPFEFD